MKFVVSTSLLLKHISYVRGAVPSSPMVPILENFLFEIKGGELTITASDLQTSLMTKLHVEAEKDGNVAVPAKMLEDTLRNLPEQPVTFHIDFDTYTIEINSDNGRYKLTGENAADFPRTPQLGRTEKIELPSDVMVSALGYTIFAASNDEMKPALNGVYMSFSEKESNFVSSDSHRLIRYKRSDVKSSQEASIIVHKKALNLLKATLPADGNSILKMEFNQSNAIFSFDHFKMICRLIDERFPDYQNVIPVKNNNKVVVDRSELLSCLKRIVIYSNRSTNQVRFKIYGSELQVSAEDFDFSNEASERLKCDHNGADLEIGFNARFLIEMLNNIHSKTVEFRLSEPNSAALLAPTDGYDDEDLLMLVMPIMLHNYV